MNWTVENDDVCKRTIFEGGAGIVGFTFPKPAAPVYNQMKSASLLRLSYSMILRSTVNVNIKGSPKAKFD